MSDTTPHNFDSQTLSHRIAAAFVTDHAFDPDRITYYPAQPDTQAGVRIATHKGTWCHIVDGEGDTLTWHVVCEMGTAATGSYLVDVADGTIDGAYMPTNRIVTMLEQIITATMYATMPKTPEK